MEVFSCFTVALATVTVGLLSVYYWLFYHRLRRCGIQGPRPFPFVGTIPQQLSMGTFTADKTWTHKYGKIFGLYAGHCPQVVVQDEELLKHVFVKDFNQFTNRQGMVPLPDLFMKGLFFLNDRKWKLTRNIMSPSFSAGKLKQMCPIINTCAEKLSRNLLKETENQEPPKPIKTFLGAFTIDAIASVAFGLDIDSQTHPDEPFVKNARAIFAQRPGVLSRILITFSFVFPGVGYFLTKVGLNLFRSESVTFFDQTGRAIINDRKENPTDRVDILQLLLNAEHVEDNTLDSNADDKSGDKQRKVHPGTVHRLKVDEINAQAFLFFLAGYETTASLLQYATYMLAVHPDMDQRLVDEIDEKLHDQIPTYDNISQMDYLDAFINETLRFYPPFTRISRVASRDLCYGNITIPRGSTVLVPVYHIHHDPDYYHDPDEFIPERFLGENKANINPVTFLPFGYGPRNCIGIRLALVEAKLALVHMLRKVRFVRTSETQDPHDIKWINNTLLVPEKPIVLGIERRE